MRRVKRHKIKREQPESSASFSREQEEHDLAYYIHDRVELMHQVFSVLKPKDLKAMAPECVRRISIDDLQELCTEELLGISSKRLCAILDGAEPPSDTESSSQSPTEQMETISLDSISSDEEILSQASSKKKKHKHRRREGKTKSKHRKKSKEPAEDEEGTGGERSRASRAGLTVLELLELQARARAIRAQLHQEHQDHQELTKQPSESAAVESGPHSSDNEVEIKEEPPEVVVLSSDEEKPNIQDLQKANTPSTSKESDKNEKDSPKQDKNKEKRCKKDKKKNKEKETSESNKEPEKTTETRKVDSTQTVTKRINDLIITVPQQHTRKIKLNRNKITASTSTETVTVTTVTPVTTKSVTDIVEKQKEKPKEKVKKKNKKKDKKKDVDKDNSDHDEITLQLSDSEKMDLLEDLDRKNYDVVSSSSSEDSESSSDSESDTQESSKDNSIEKPHIVKDNSIEAQKETIVSDNKVETEQKQDDPDITNADDLDNNTTEKEITKVIEKENDSLNTNIENQRNDKRNEQYENNSPKNEVECLDNSNKFQSVENNTNIDNCTKIPDENYKTDENIVISDIDDIPIHDDSNTESQERKDTKISAEVIEELKEQPNDKAVAEIQVSENVLDKDNVPSEGRCTDSQGDLQLNAENNVQNKKHKELSDGELSDHESSEVEASEVKLEVVCISDEEDEKAKKKKKKKDKKAKKEKKSKKSKSDFREGADQNFYRDTVQNIDDTVKQSKATENKECIDLDSDHVLEIMELSDDSSCYEVEGTVLSKEPTAEEIEALSARIDEIEREEVVTEEQIREHERTQKENEEDKEELHNISWKDRYLDSKKVKKVLSTSNILNALRKKNKELKKKLEESKKKEEVSEVEEKVVNTNEVKELEEGSIEHFNTLQGSTKYVDPVSEKTDPVEKDIEDKSIEIEVTGDMKKDAKQLLKMYKKLLKYNDMTKQKDPNKKKKKKQKKKEKDVSAGSTEINSSI